jgi:hypothetical protein
VNLLTVGENRDRENTEAPDPRPLMDFQIVRPPGPPSGTILSKRRHYEGSGYKVCNDDYLDLCEANTAVVEEFYADDEDWERDT